MQFSEEDIGGARSAIEGIGASDVYALALYLRGGTIQIQILRHVGNTLTPIALPSHPYYCEEWNEADAFLNKVFVTKPENIIRVSDWFTFNYGSLLRNL